MNLMQTFEDCNVMGYSENQSGPRLKENIFNEESIFNVTFNSQLLK